VTRIKTFIKFLDNLNFPNGINPYGEPDGEEAFSKDEFYVNQKITENKDLMEFELVSILELQDVRIPARRIMADYCSWIYRSSKGCGYNGVPVADLYNKKIQDAGYVGNLVGGESYLGDFQFLEDPPGTVSIPRWAQTGVYQKGQVVEVAPCGYNPETKPTTLYVCLADNMRSNPAYDEDNWVKDDCSKDLQGCRLRFGEGAPQGQESTKGIPFGAFPGVAKFLP
jgi:phage-related protein